MILVFFLWGMTFCWAMDVEMLKLPLPRESQNIWQDKSVEVNNIKVQANFLTSNLGKEELSKFYQELLGQNGWKLTDHDEDQDIMCFTRNGNYFYVAIVEDAGRKDAGRSSVYLVKSPSDLRLCRTLVDYFFKPEIAPDAEGKDAPDIPRYPGSRRRLNIFTKEEGQFLMYETEAAPKEVEGFYRKMLTQYGWELMPQLNPALLARFSEAREALKNVCLLGFQRGQEMLFITAYPTPREVSKARTLISITRNFYQELYPEGE
ncbi:MAG: hypothetical protein NC928_05160 [Candidatus Omnitrophica bacterium]|nr:hypothetical protein [Candidatus Omnitrophota bacterium]